ncbi:MAG: hypothetical protein AABW99_04290 [archaeon]
MNKIVKDGIIFSLAVLIVFVLVSFINIISTWDYSAHGFPFPYYESWGPCLGGNTCEKATPINLVLDILIAVAAGFAISYVKNSVVKK